MKTFLMAAVISFVVSLAISSPLVWGDSRTNVREIDKQGIDQRQPDGWQEQQWQMQEQKPNQSYEKPNGYGVWLGLYIQEDENTG
jgi:hypothetical protein